MSSMIVAETGLLIYIDLGKGEPGMVLQRREGREWVDYVVGGEVVKSPFDIDTLAAGECWLEEGFPVSPP